LIIINTKNNVEIEKGKKGRLIHLNWNMLKLIWLLLLSKWNVQIEELNRKGLKYMNWTLKMKFDYYQQ